MSAFGRILAAPTLERGVEVCMRLFLTPYVGEVLRQAGLPQDAIADPTDLVRLPEYDYPPENDVALVIVATPGTIGDARRDAGSYTATWDIRVGVVADLGARLDSMEAAGYYAAAAGAALTHQGVAQVSSDGRSWLRDEDGELLLLDGAVVRWAGESYRPLPERDGRALVAGEARFNITVEGARSDEGPEFIPDLPEDGPVDRDPPPEADPSPVVPSLTLHRVPITEE